MPLCLKTDFISCDNTRRLNIIYSTKKIIGNVHIRLVIVEKFEVKYFSFNVLAMELHFYTGFHQQII